MPETTTEMSSVEYEKLIQSIHKILFHAEGRETIDVEHNVKLTDLHGQEHQIDVFWRFQIAGIEYRTAIECKHYKKPVSKSQVATFALIISKIGNINGIMVTSAGFQSGAEELANNCGIRLVIARSPTERDLEGILKTIILNIHASRSIFTIAKLSLCERWFKSSGLLDVSSLQFLTMESEGIYNAEGGLMQTWIQLCNQIEATVTPLSELNKTRTYEKSFEEAFVKSVAFGLIPLKDIQILAEVQTVTNVCQLNAPDINSYIMKDIKSGDTRWLYGSTDSLRLKPFMDNSD